MRKGQFFEFYVAISVPAVFILFPNLNFWTLKLVKVPSFLSHYIIPSFNVSRLGTVHRNNTTYGYGSFPMVDC